LVKHGRIRSEHEDDRLVRRRLPHQRVHAPNRVHVGGRTIIAVHPINQRSGLASTFADALHHSHLGFEHDQVAQEVSAFLIKTNTRFEVILEPYGYG
jgi:hypothetical protein